jgi:hypothetical protein
MKIAKTKTTQYVYIYKMYRRGRETGDYKIQFKHRIYKITMFELLVL